MSGPRPRPLNLTGAERVALESFVARHTTGQQLALRARIVLGVAAGQGTAELARQFGVSETTVRLWRDRWGICQAVPLDELSVAERLADLPRPGAPARLTPEQVCQIVALACEKPAESDRPISHWTPREIADEVLKRGIVAQISPRHVGRLLKIGRSQTPSHPLLAHARTR